MAELLIQLNNEANESNNLTPTVRVKTIYGLASALEYMHKLGFVHPDIIPERLSYDILMEVRLCSFDHCARYALSST